MKVHYKKDCHFEDIFPNLNNFIACFYTCWARLSLFEVLELLQQRVLYFDTDSIVFMDTPFQPTPQLGLFLGQFKDELAEDGHTVDFSAGRPKNYGCITASGNITYKVQGFSLNCEGLAPPHTPPSHPTLTIPISAPSSLYHTPPYIFISYTLTILQSISKMPTKNY